MVDGIPAIAPSPPSTTRPVAAAALVQFSRRARNDGDGIASLPFAPRFSIVSRMFGRDRRTDGRGRRRPCCCYGRPIRPRPTVMGEKKTGTVPATSRYRARTIGSQSFATLKPRRQPRSRTKPSVVQFSRPLGAITFIVT